MSAQPAALQAHEYVEDRLQGQRAQIGGRINHDRFENKCCEVLGVFLDGTHDEIGVPVRYGELCIGRI